MLWCSHCQRDNEPEAVFCSYCGQQLAASTYPNTPYTDVTVDLEQQQVIPPSTGPQVPQKSATSQSTPSLKDLGQIGAIIAACTLGIVLLIPVLRLSAGVLRIMIPILVLGGVSWLLIARWTGRKYIPDWLLAILALGTMLLMLRFGWLILPFFFIGIGFHKKAQQP